MSLNIFCCFTQSTILLVLKFAIVAVPLTIFKTKIKAEIRNVYDVAEQFDMLEISTTKTPILVSLEYQKLFCEYLISPQTTVDELLT